MRLQPILSPYVNIYNLYFPIEYEQLQPIPPHRMRLEPVLSPYNEVTTVTFSIE